jgi:hypothetical protein
LIPILAKRLGSIGYPGAIAQVGLGYFWIALLIFYLRPWETGLRHPVWLYFLVGIIDFEGNFCISEAFGFLPPLSGRFLLTLNLPFSFVLGFLSDRGSRLPSPVQIVGLLAVISSVVLVSGSDYTRGDQPTEAWAQGILLGVTSAFLGSLSSVIQGALLTSGEDRESKEIEMISMMGIAGFIVSCIQLPLWELHRYTEKSLSTESILEILVISICIFIFYFGTISYNKEYPNILRYNMLTVNAFVFLGDLVFFRDWSVLDVWMASGYLLNVGGALVFYLADHSEVKHDIDEVQPLVSQK